MRRMRHGLRVDFPTHEEAEKIIPIIKDVLERANVEIKVIGEHPKGGVMADATLPPEKKDALVSELFGQGIVMVEAPLGGLGFAVCR